MIEETDTIGAALKRARERRDMTLEKVSEITRIRVDFLTAIEAMDVRSLPETPFALGFVRVYAAEVGLNPQDASEAFAAQTAVRQRPATPARASLEPKANGQGPLRAALAGAAALIVVAIAVLGLREDRAPRLADTIPPVPEALTTWVASEPGSDQGARALSALTAQDGPVILVQARIPVWIEVTDAVGDRVHAGELKAGERYRAPQLPGLRLSAGNGGALEVFRDGERLGLAGQPGLPVTQRSLDDLRFEVYAGLPG